MKPIPQLKIGFFRESSCDKTVAFYVKIGYNNKAVLITKNIDQAAEQGRNACDKICGRAGSVRQGAVNHVRRGTEQH